MKSNTVIRWKFPKAEVQQGILRQLETLFPYPDPSDSEGLGRAFERIEPRLARILRVGNSPHFRTAEDEPLFSPLNSDQSTILLYLLSAASAQLGYCTLAERLYLLNKALNGIDLFYAVELPDLFLVSHPVGTVLGRAQYRDFFFVAQNCTVGNANGIYPRFGRGCILHAGASVLGDCEVGDNVCFGAGAFVINRNVPSNRIVTGRGSEAQFREAEPGFWKRYFRRDVVDREAD